ncbi:calcium release-activated calcium channel protein 1-like [Cloeon dipterum]|uniref:calcium release-activated calcium channel protein 1-like n=1 Tax=Cloeon dipterum TaxID=197152 RepID=UPI00321FDC15
MANENSLHRAGFHVLNTKEGVQWRIFHHGYADLEVTTKTSIFLAVFGMGIVSSYQINYPTQVPSWLVAVMLSNSVFLISLHSFAFVIGTWLLPNLEAVSEEYVPPQEGQLKIKPVPSFSPHERFSGFVRMSHRISHVFGLFIFLAQVPLVSWVKYWDVSKNAAIASTAIMVPFMGFFALFCWLFHFHFFSHVFQTRQEVINEVENQYKSVSQESLNCSNYCDCCKGAQESANIVSRRHSLDPDFKVAYDIMRRKSSSLKSVTLQTVMEQTE